ncbi:glycosyltransferase involved in cell wall biosynthesis [Mycolicibacterium sp. 624]
MSMTTAQVPPIARRALTLLDPAMARSMVGLANVPTIAAMGPFEDRLDAQRLATAFIAVRQCCTAQLVLVGTGPQRTTVTRRIFVQGLGNSVRSVRDCSDHQRTNLIAAADVVVLGSSSGSTTLLDVLAAGRPVVAPADAETVPLVVPAIAGIVYRPGDVVGLESALLRLLTTPVLRRGMGVRARHVARRHHMESMRSAASSGQQEPRTGGSRDDTRAMAADRGGSPVKDYPPRGEGPPCESK